MRQYEPIIFAPSIEEGGVEKNLFLISNFLSKKLKNLTIITANNNKKKYCKIYKKENKLPHYDEADYTKGIMYGEIMFTASIIGETITSLIKEKKENVKKILISGGGRKNSFLIKSIAKNLPEKINTQLIDDYGIDGDFVESQAFAYLAIRSFLKLPISFPNTTGCKKPCTGGVLVKNY